MRMLLAAAAALLTSGVARADPELALRLGAALPIGSAAPDVTLSDIAQAQFPAQVDALWRFGRLGVGGYASWALARAADCGSGTSCESRVSRFGGQATFTFVPAERAAARAASGSRPPEPWAGISAGWERLTDRRARAGKEASTRWHGVEVVALQGGLDWPIGAHLAIGPALLVGLGRYTDIRVDTGYDSDTTPLSRTAVHAWVHLGVRVRVRLEREAP